MSTDTVAERLNVTSGYVRRLARNGKLPGARKIGRDWLIPEAAVKHYQQERRGPGRPPEDD